MNHLDHVIQFHHKPNLVVVVSCRCGAGTVVRGTAAGDWARRHRIAMGTMGRYLFRFNL